MSKTLIVAQREYVENLRTKTFWIGIFSLPVIFALFIFVGRILERSKDVRTYAILDLSEDQWLSEAVESRADQGDLQTAMRRYLERLQEAAGEEGADADTVAAAARVVSEELGTNEVRREFFTRLTDTLERLLRRAEAAGRPLDLGAEVRRELSSDGGLAEFYTGLSPEQLELLADKLDRTRYQRVEIRDGDLSASASPDEVRADLNRRVRDGRLFAYFVIPEDPLEAGAGRYVSNNLTDNDLRQWFESNATEIVRQRRIDRMEGVSEAEARKLLARFGFEEEKPGEGAATEAVGAGEKASSFAPVAFVYLLWIAVFTAAQMLLTNTVEEKSNRLIEVLLSSVSPLQLMSGKVLGIAATGLTIVISWVATALVGAQLVPASSPLGGGALVAIIGDPLYLGSFVAYFLAGYLLYAAILVALGSVCDSLKEAQNLMQPVFILLIVPLVAMIFVVQDPNGAVARVLTYVPLYTPFLMMNRAGGPPPAWEYVASTVVIVVSVALAFWAAAKIFRVGILMTGKPPKVGEILRWLRAPVGAVHVPRAPEPEA